jgi:hypothetical protein
MGISFGVITVCYVKVYRNMKKMSKEFIKLYQINSKKLFWYPFGLYLCFLPAILDIMIQDLFKITIPWLGYFHIFLGHSLAFINALIYRVVTYESSKTNSKQMSFASAETSFEEEISTQQANGVSLVNNKEVAIIKNNQKMNGTVL